MTIDLFRLRVFVAVVDRNGYSAAARHLYLAQATVSHHVHELEKALGSPLLRYDQRAVHLTAAGREAYRAARVMLLELERLEQSLADLKQGRRGRVRLGASMAFEQRYFFERVIEPFCKHHDGVLLSVRFGHSRREAQAVLDGELDIAYVISWQLPTEAEFEPLQDARVTFLVSPGHALAQQDVATVEEIARAGLITAPLDSVESAFYSQVLRECGLDAQDSVMEVDGMQGRVLAAEAGLGVLCTFYPQYAGDSFARSLVSLATPNPLPSVKLGLVCRPAHVSSGALAALAAWLRSLHAP